MTDRQHRWGRNVGIAGACVLLAAAVASAAPQGIPAFPGAEGAGSRTVGGRGGAVYEVTTLEDAGPGSLRDAVSRGDRTIVFRVAGTIDLKSRIDLRQPRVTIAGQTAPGGGICLKNYSLNIYTQDVIVRHLRVRLGDLSAQQTDAFTIWHGARNVVIDHCSAGWSVDEALSLAGDVQDVTIQWCVISEALRQSVHAKGPHGFGSLSRANGPVTWHHNLWAHNDARNPRLGDNYGKDPRPLFDVRNNVMYDYGSACSGLTQGIFQANYVGNYIRPGPSSTAKTPISVGGPSELKFFLSGNVFEGNEALTSDNTRFFNTVEIEGKRQVETANVPFKVEPVRTTSAQEAYEAVLAGAGATLPKRDSVDERVVRQVRDRGGRMIDSQREVGGWPDLAMGAAPADGDHDGMPDEWERRHRLDPASPSDGPADKDGDGYTNLEECLNATDPNVFVDYRVAAESGAGPTTQPR